MPESPSGPQKTETPRHERTTSEESTMGPSISGQLSQRLDELRSEMTSALENAADAAVGEVLKSIAAIDRAKTQSEILQALLEGAVRFASRAAFFLTRPEKICGWAGEGFGRAGAQLEGLEIDYEGFWSALAAGTGALPLTHEDCAALSSRIGAAEAQDGLLIPFVLRGQLGGGLYTDRLPGDKSLGVSSLLLLTHTASQALETAVFRSAPSPSLRLSEAAEAASGLRLWQQEPTAPEASPADDLGTTRQPGDRESAEEAPVDQLVEEPGRPGEEIPALEAESAGTGIEEGAVDVAFEVTPEPEPLAETDAPEPPSVTEPAPIMMDMADAQEPALRDEADLQDPTHLEEPAGDFGFEAADSPEDLEDELTEEPELEDTGTDIWALEDEEEDATIVTTPAADQPVPAVDDVRDVAAGESSSATPIVGQETVRLDVAALQGQSPADLSPPAPAAQGFEVPEETPSPPVEYELEPVDEPAPEPTTPEATVLAKPEEPARSTPAQADTFDDGEDPTLITSQPLATTAGPPPTQEPAADAGYVPSAPSDASGTQKSASTEVRPPADLQGPGSAFAHSSGVSAEITSNEEALHEEARRLARLLVSEIKLYNEEIIEEGRRNGDIYERLKDDIDRSRQMYKERIDPRLHGKENYFRQELIQRLAGGDEALLGM